MGRVFLSQAEATQYAPTAGETLHDIVANKCDKENPPITCDEVAHFNWGTSEKPEVLRALLELVGCRKIDPDPYKCELDPAKALKVKVYLPKLWKKKGLAFEKKHKLVVKQTKPLNAVRLTKLSKWFLPQYETCELDYGLEGLKETADKVAVEIWASNYCKATRVKDHGLFKYQYAPLNVPVFQKNMTAPGEAGQRVSASLPGYRGESTAATGVLKKRGASTRFLNAANSPYTFVLKYYKQKGDSDA